MIYIIISRSSFFITIHIFVVNKISTNSNVDCKNYWKYHNVQGARAAFIFILIFTSYFYFINSFSIFFSLFINLFFPALTMFITKIFSNITWCITFTFTITRIPNISFMTYTFTKKFAPAFIIIPTLFIVTNTCI